MNEIESQDGFRAWITGQAGLRCETGTSDTEATELQALSETVT